MKTRGRRLRSVRWLAGAAVLIGTVAAVTGGGAVVRAEAATTLSAGQGHTCVVLSAEVQCWGQNDVGQLGNGTNTQSVVPVTATGLTDVTSVAAGKRHTCAIKSDETLWCWGANNQGALGLGNYSNVNVPTLTPLTGVMHVSTGVNQTCATKTDFTIWCSGGPTGDGTGNGSNSFVQVSGITNGKMTASGEFTSCAALNDGTARCWGNNSFGRLGIGVMGGEYDAPQTVLNLTTVDTIHLDGSSTCAVLTDDTVSCWGANFFGQLGDGTTSSSSTPVAVPGLTGVEHLDVSQSGACAIKSDDTLWCWGSNVYYAMQQPSTTSFLNTPTQITLPFTPDLIAGGQLHFCSLATDGTTIGCWGSNRDGQLSGSVTEEVRIPLTVQGVSGSQITAGNVHTCAVLTTGGVSCWGGNDTNQTGAGVSSGPPTPPTAVVGVTNAEWVEAGGATGSVQAATCSRFTDDSLSCWPPMLSDPGLSLGTVDHSFGSGFGCAVLTDNTIECWGSNTQGQLGDGTTNFASTPVAVDGITTADKVDAGFLHTCAVLADDTARCWGHNFQGKLGDGTTNQALTPVTVTGLTGVDDISAGDSHTCAVKTDGTVWCWGDDYPGGALGDGLGTSSTTPVQVSGITDAIAVEAGDGGACAVHTGGTVSCWGANGSGQLGDGSLFGSDVPVTVTGVTGADQISYTDETVCVHKTDDTFMCWGFNVYGQTGTPSYTSTPYIVPFGAAALCNGLTPTVLLGSGGVPTPGPDVILGTDNADVVDGLDGDDVICGLDGDDTIEGGNGLDTIFGDGGVDDLSGGKNNDIIYGGAEGDTLYGGGGGDRLYGEDGDDTVRGGNGNDVIEGGPGADELRGQNGEDEIWANSAADSSTTDVDQMYGGGLYDDVTGDNGDDILYGGNFADVLSGKSGDDQLFGNNGEDTLRGGPHVLGDTCNGGTLNSGAGDTATACETVLNVP